MRAGHATNIAMRTIGISGKSQRPVVRYSSMSGMKCIRMTTSSVRKTQNSTNDSHVPGTK